jgi:hypothetical protein
MSVIIEKIYETLNEINSFGDKINSTKEVQSKFITIKRYEHDGDLQVDLDEIGDFYQRNIGDWKARCDLERDHYHFLESFIIHKIGEVRYFHKQEDLTSRKFVIWSSDCIASIQFLHRPESQKNILNVFIRSSDALNLLPADLFAMLLMLDRICERFNLIKYTEDEVNYFITSCHYYLKDEDKVRKILQ